MENEEIEPTVSRSSTSSTEASDALSVIADSQAQARQAAAPPRWQMALLAFLVGANLAALAIPDSWGWQGTMVKLIIAIAFVAYLAVATRRQRTRPAHSDRWLIHLFSFKTYSLPLLGILVVYLLLVFLPGSALVWWGYLLIGVAFVAVIYFLLAWNWSRWVVGKGRARG